MKGKLWVSAMILFCGSFLTNTARSQSPNTIFGNARQMVGEPDGSGDLPDSVAKSFLDQFIRELPNFAVAQRETTYNIPNGRDSLRLKANFYTDVSVTLKTRGNKKFALEWIDPESASYNYLIANSGLNRYMRLDTVVKSVNAWHTLLRGDVIGIVGAYKKDGAKASTVTQISADSIFKAQTSSGTSYFIYKGQPEPSLHYLQITPSVETLYCFVYAVYPKFYITDDRTDTGASAIQRKYLKFFPPLVSPDTSVIVTYSAILDTTSDGGAAHKSIDILDEPVRDAAINYIAYKYFMRKQMFPQAEFYKGEYEKLMNGWFVSRRMLGAASPK